MLVCLCAIPRHDGQMLTDVAVGRATEEQVHHLTHEAPRLFVGAGERAEKRLLVGTTTARVLGRLGDLAHVLSDCLADDLLRELEGHNFTTHEVLTDLRAARRWLTAHRGELVYTLQILN